LGDRGEDLQAVESGAECGRPGGWAETRLRSSTGNEGRCDRPPSQRAERSWAYASYVAKPAHLPQECRLASKPPDDQTADDACHSGATDQRLDKQLAVKGVLSEQEAEFHMRQFLSRSAESIRVLGRAAHHNGDDAQMRELLAELSHRSSSEARRIAAELAPLVDDTNSLIRGKRQGDRQPPGHWLSGIEAAARGHRARNPGSRTVYLLLLHSPERDSPFGVYVGKTGLTAEQRLANHQRGHKTKPYITRYLVRLLTPFFEHLRDISEEDAIQIERSLAADLRDEGYWVKGGH
jgi:hypothetical protein